MEKLFCFVDETGQHTQGIVFVVAVVVAKQDKEAMHTRLEQIEQQSGKKKTKWMKSSQPAKQAYIQQVCDCTLFQRRLYYSLTEHTIEYRPLTLETIANTVAAVRQTQRYKASVFIDGLPRPEYRLVSTQLHRLGVQTEKVRGVADQSNALIRLADAIAGLVREAAEGRNYAQLLRQQAEEAGVLVRV